MSEKRPRTTADAQQASRIRDNKRRHRARRKEYVSELEQKLADLKADGVKATVEVQRAAQLIAKENVSLRLLLRQNGFADENVDSWLKQQVYQTNGGIHDGARPQAQEKVLATGQCKQGTTCASKMKTMDVASYQTFPLSNNGSLETTPMINTSNDIISIENVANATAPPKTVEPKTMEEISGASATPKKACKNTCRSKSEPDLPSNIPSATPPCKLLTHMAENPGVDITQIPISTAPSSSGSGYADIPDDGTDGVECGAAYKMLMQYATSEEKLLEISQALEEGCTVSSNGGCKVKNSAIWKVLDGACG